MKVIKTGTFNKYRLKGAYHYDWYETEAWYKACVDECVEFCKGSTLEVGCGDGVLSNKIAENYLVVGIDTDEDGLKLADQHRTREFNPAFLLQSVDDLSHGEWQYLACLNVIEHLDKPYALKEIIRNNISKGAIIMTLEWQGGAYGEDHKHEYTLDELTDFFKEFKPKPFRIKDYPEWIGVKIKL